MRCDREKSDNEPALCISGSDERRPMEKRLKINREY